jgi:hypothetical protein
LKPDLLLTILFLSAGSANATDFTENTAPVTVHYHCDYAFMGAPFVTLEFDKTDNDHLSKTVRVSQYGSAHNESFTEVAHAANEKIHAWVSKESKDNKIEYILYSSPQAAGNSEIINNQMPMAKEIWGTCIES